MVLEKVSAAIMKYALWGALILFSVGLIINALHDNVATILFRAASLLLIVAPVVIVASILVLSALKRKSAMVLICLAYLTLLSLGIFKFIV